MYLGSENKGADRAVPTQLFSHMQKAGFLMTRLTYYSKLLHFISVLPVKCQEKLSISLDKLPVVTILKYK